ncbi:hypothetical protein KC345_g9603 [Hortaea werneckii]|nr:hypothetical protein KC345_g9603 [Hortaea werneckii]
MAETSSGDLATQGIPSTPRTANPIPSITSSAGFSFPSYTSFPPFYTLQPNLTTRARQLELWSSLITTYCTYHRIFRLSLSALPSDLFSNASIHRSLKPADIRMVLDHMSRPENGPRVEWIAPAARGEQSASCWVYWKTPTEWADAIYGWVDETGQKGAVLTVYELREGDAVRSQAWRDMDEELLRKALGVLVKRGKAQVFGQEETAGVKFF